MIDPVPLMTMDKKLTACTGMDALTHAIEAYVSNSQSVLTDIHSIDAIKRITAHINDAVNLENRNVDTMQQMLFGSLTAGLAFSNASLGAVHAMAHALGGLLDLPHGECNSILLRHVMEINYDGAKDRFENIGKAMGLPMDKDEKTNKKMLLDAIDSLRDSLGIDEYIKVENKKRIYHQQIS